MTVEPTDAVKANEREAFKKWWADRRSYEIGVYGYARESSDEAWAAWEYRASLASPAAVEPKGATKRRHRHTAVCWRWCDRCDGCGWYECGETIQTTCRECNGTGREYLCKEWKRLALRPPAENDKGGA